MADRPKRNADGKNQPHLTLHVPEPSYRPDADDVDFSAIEIPEAGAQPRPDEACDPEETHGLCTDLIRVLGDDNRAHGPWDPKLDPDTLRKMLGHMAMVRAFDERMFRGQRQGKTSFYMKCTGEEATSIATSMALQPDDMIFPSYRQQGALIARGYDRLAFLGGPESATSTQDRLTGFRAEIAQQRGVEPSVSFAGAYTFEAGRSEMQRLLQAPPAEAYFCGDDVLSIGALSALRDHGLSVPGDVGVLGLNDMEMAGWAGTDGVRVLPFRPGFRDTPGTSRLADQLRLRRPRSGRLRPSSSARRSAGLPGAVCGPNA